MDRGLDLQEAIETLDMESWLDREGYEYRLQHGSSGLQINVKECPCCGSSKWKVFLNAASGLGNCFAGDCGEKFNKWKFIRSALPNASNRDVVEHIKAVASEQGWRPAKRVSVAVNHNTELRLPASVPLPYKGRNLHYLEKRNISSDIARYFNLRFCASGGFDYESQGRRMRQDYSNRIIIPIYDLEGDLVSFQGRDITGTAERKYLFPPGFASTGSVLYNGQNAIGAKRIVLGEGVFDVAAIKIALDEEMAVRDVVPVGTFGKHLSAEGETNQLSKLLQLRELGLEQVTFMWDGELNALSDALKAALIVRRYGLQVRLAVLPPDKDPNEVPAAVVRDAFWKAFVVTPESAIRFAIQKNLPG